MIHSTLNALISFSRYIVKKEANQVKIILRVMMFFPMILRVSLPHGPRMHCMLLFFSGVSVKQTLSQFSALR